MKMIKQSVLYLFLAVELVIFVGVYFFGPNGYKHWLKLKEENNVVLQDLQTLKKEITALKKEMAVAKSDDFYKEKVARTKLQMSKKTDVIYYY